MARDINWEAIELEWRAGQRDIKSIAEEHGIKDAAIHMRAKRKGWGPRAERIEVVSRVVSQAEQLTTGANSPRVALTSFERVLHLLHRHRRMIRALIDGIDQDLADLETLMAERRAKGRKPSFEEIRLRSDIRRRCTASMKDLVELERRAFGISPTDLPSEFDGFTHDEMQAVIETVKRALRA